MTDELVCELQRINKKCTLSNDSVQASLNMAFGG
jgi:hypothetical protein